MKHIVTKIFILICFVVSNPISAKQKPHSTSKQSTQSPHNRFEKPLYFVTVADEEHVPWLNILIASIKKHNPLHEIRILVFDLGLQEDQIKKLEEDPIIAVSAL